MGRGGPRWGEVGRGGARWGDAGQGVARSSSRRRDGLQHPLRCRVTQLHFTILSYSFLGNPQFYTKPADFGEKIYSTGVVASSAARAGGSPAVRANQGGPRRAVIARRSPVFRLMSWQVPLSSHVSSRVVGDFFALSFQSEPNRCLRSAVCVAVGFRPRLIRSDNFSFANAQSYLSLRPCTYREQR